MILKGILCKKMEFFFQSIIQRTVGNAIRPSQQPTVSPNYSQSIKINIGPSEDGTIVPSSHRPTVLY